MNILPKSQIQKCFEEFDKQITLGEAQISRIESARRGLSGYVSKYFGLEQNQIFIQGSYANDTAIKPVDGRAYDVDIVVESSNFLETADKALDNLHKSLISHATYSEKLESKTPCVRINYADDLIGSFHVDVVPVRRNESSLAPFDAPRRNGGWHATAPKEYTEWCNQQGELYKRTIRMLKRWRDEQQEESVAIKSIILQVLSAEHISSEKDDATRITNYFLSLQSYLSGQNETPAILNPVLDSENLSSRWENTHFQDFRSEVSLAAQNAKSALAATNEVEAADYWRSVFGEDFPLAKVESQENLELGDTSHIQNASEMGWTEALQENIRISISCKQRSSKSSKLISYQGGSSVLTTSRSLKFEASIEPRNLLNTGAKVWWRITNTGEIAHSFGSLRGNFILARGEGGGTSPNELINWERTSYKGVHLVEAFLVRNSLVIAKSEVFKVNIR